LFFVPKLLDLEQCPIKTAVCTTAAIKQIFMDNDKFIFCLESVPDAESYTNTEVFQNLGNCFEQG
jgi:hypothetical protein